MATYSTVMTLHATQADAIADAAADATDANALNASYLSQRKGLIPKAVRQSVNQPPNPEAMPCHGMPFPKMKR
jgi:hypothetical protein